jgi:SPP1 gp7 family putative phage head morphogenesis protein
MRLNLNTVLAPIDRRAERFSLGFSRKVYRLSLSASFSNTESMKDLEVAFAKQLFDYMMSAHKLGQQAARSRYAKCAASSPAWQPPDKRSRDSMHEFYDSIAKSASNKTMATVRDRMLGSVQALLEDKPKDYRAQLRGVVMKSAPQHLVKTVERTQTSMAFNAATWVETYHDEDLWGYEYTTAGDERVRDTHVPFDGVQYPKDDVFWALYAPPNGWNCRCGLSPVYGRARTIKYKGTPDVDTAFKWNAGAMFKQGV